MAPGAVPSPRPSAGHKSIPSAQRDRHSNGHKQASVSDGLRAGRPPSPRRPPAAGQTPAGQTPVGSTPLPQTTASDSTQSCDPPRDPGRCSASPFRGTGMPPGLRAGHPGTRTACGRQPGQPTRTQTRGGLPSTTALSFHNSRPREPREPGWAVCPQLPTPQAEEGGPRGPWTSQADRLGPGPGAAELQGHVAFRPQLHTWLQHLLSPPGAQGARTVMSPVPRCGT